MNNEIRNLIRLNTIRDIELALLQQKEKGMIIPEVVFETIREVEASYELPPEVINEHLTRD